MKKILVAVDLSDAGSTVCAVACDLARRMDASLVLLHAVQPVPVLPTDIYALDVGSLDEMLGALSEAGRRRLAVLARSCGRRGVEVKTVVRIGAPAAVILGGARGAGCIVLGSHGHGAMYDLLVGSTAQGVLRKAPCPVLVVPTRRGARGAPRVERARAQEGAT